MVKELDWPELAGLPLPWGDNLEAPLPDYPFVVMTRLQTYRNFSGFPFLVSAPPNTCAAIADKALHQLTRLGGYTIRRLSDCPNSVIRMLRERHLLPERSTPFPGKKETKYLAVGSGGKNWVIVNEVEHLTFGRVSAGRLSEMDFVSVFQSEESSWQTGSGDENQPWAWSHRLGYLTSNPARIGPGLEVELLVHLPGLALARQLSQARNTMAASGIGFAPVTQIGASEAGLFILKSRGGAGRSVVEVYSDFLSRAQPLMDWEKGLQVRCLEKHSKRLKDRVQISLQGLANTHVLSYPELLAKGSYLRLGAYQGLVSPQIAGIVEELRVTAGSGHLGVISGRTLTEEEEGIQRANVVRSALESLRV